MSDEPMTLRSRGRRFAFWHLIAAAFFGSVLAQCAMSHAGYGMRGGCACHGVVANPAKEARK